jgi:hypothetical protein
MDQMWWLIPVILVTQETEMGGWHFEASPGKRLIRSHLNKKAGHSGTGLLSQLCKRYK